MLTKRVQDVGIQYFEVIYEEQMMAKSRTTQNTTSKHKIPPFILLYSDKQMLSKRVLCQRKRKN
jgi:hypothetical protein